MTTTPDRPEALRLAAWLNEGAWHKMRLGDVLAAGAELRRLHAENNRLTAALSAAAPAAPDDKTLAGWQFRQESHRRDIHARSPSGRAYLVLGGDMNRVAGRQLLNDMVAALIDCPAAPIAPVKPFQQRVQPWLLACFGEMIAGDREERNHRFLEEALELVQSCGCTAGEAHQLVDYVFGRPVGEPAQEVGGVMVTLAALCLAHRLDMHDAGEVELARIWTKVDAIRAKQAAKPKHSPRPMAAAPAPPEHPAMPDHWAVVASINGQDVLCISDNAVAGAGEPSEAQVQAITGMAQHPLAFVGYGWPPPHRA